MKKILLPLICCNFFLFSAKAQLEKFWGDPHVPEKFTSMAAKDPAYITFQKEFNALVKSCKGANTNAGAFKKLFTDYRSLFTALYTKAGMKPSQPMSVNRSRMNTKLVAAFNSPALKNVVAMAMQSDFLPPFDKSWWNSGHPITNDPPPFDTAGSSFASGKVIATVNSAISPGKAYLGIYGRGYTKKIKFTNNPEVLAAKIQFHYSFDYTGWDTYGAKTAINLILRTSNNNFNSSAYDELPPPSPFHALNDRWKVIANLLPIDSVTTDFDEIHLAADSVFSIEGYITPGSETDFMFGFAYPQGTNRGLNGCYHYGEFILKKITVTYYKSAQ
jgi:hypothetical protein